MITDPNLNGKNIGQHSANGNQQFHHQKSDLNGVAPTNKLQNLFSSRKDTGNQRKLKRRVQSSALVENNAEKVE
jgi:hypothetical protein